MIALLSVSETEKPPVGTFMGGRHRGTTYLDLYTASGEHVAAGEAATTGQVATSRSPMQGGSTTERLCCLSTCWSRLLPRDSASSMTAFHERGNLVPKGMTMRYRTLVLVFGLVAVVAWTSAWIGAAIVAALAVPTAGPVARCRSAANATSRRRWRTSIASGLVAKQIETAWPIEYDAACFHLKRRFLHRRSCC